MNTADIWSTCDVLNHLQKPMLDNQRARGANKPAMPVITPEIAREYAERSHEARRLRTAEHKPAPQIAETVAGSTSEEYRTRAIQRLEEQMESIDLQIDEVHEPDDWHKLTTARSKLFEQWRILSGIPMPGSRKPAADKPARQRPAMVEPS